MSERIYWIDTTKGILIILMVLGHIFSEGIVRDFIYTFHMPAFLIISGMFLHRSIDREWKSILWSKIYTIFIQMVFFEVFGIIGDILDHGYHQSIFGYVYNFIHFSPNNRTSWFLQGLFFGSLLTILLHKKVKNWKIHLILSFCFMVVYSLLSNEVQWQRVISFILITYCLENIGLYLKDLLIETDNLFYFIGALAFTVICSRINYAEVAHIQIGNPVLFFLGSITGLYTVMYISRHITLKFLTYSGKNSIVFVGTQYCLIYLSRTITNMFLGEHLFFEEIIVFVITICFELITIYILNKWTPFLIGKKMSKRV